MLRDSQVLEKLKSGIQTAIPYQLSFFHQQQFVMVQFLRVGLVRLLGTHGKTTVGQEALKDCVHSTRLSKSNCHKLKRIEEKRNKGFYLLSSLEQVHLEQTFL